MKNYFAYIIILLVTGFMGYLGFFRSEKAQPTNDQQIMPTSGSIQWETKTDEQANVTVVVTPLDLSPESAEWKFDVVIDTHSVELDQDLIKSVVLIDDQGKEYKPLRWEGAGPGGHHREGVLVFEANPPAGGPMSSYVELKVRDVGGVPERSFKWVIE